MGLGDIILVLVLIIIVLILFLAYFLGQPSPPRRGW